MTEDFDAEYTLILPHADVCELIAGRVPRGVIVACLSAVKALTEPAEESVTRPRRRRKEQTAA